MDNILEEKFRNFSTLVMADARKKSDKLTHEAEEKSKKELSEKEDQFLNNAYNLIQRNVAKYSKEDNEKILHIEVEAKKKILKKREEIINDVFKSVVCRINDFMTDADYEPWLISLARKALSEIGAGEKIIYLVSQDMKFADKIIALGENIKVEELPTAELIGGIRAFNSAERISVDYSFRALLEVQKSEFLQYAELSIN